VTIRTTITATDSAIQFDETGQYRFRADGQECTASSRRTRQYQLVERLAAPSEAEAPALNTAVPLAIDSKPRCQDLGPAVSGEVQPETKLLRPGDTATFEITLRDAAGCSLPTSAASVVFEPALGGVQWNAAGRVVAAADALEGETELVLRAGSVLDRAKISIVSQAHFESLMAAGSDERALIAAPTPAPTSVTTLGAETAVAENRAGTRKVLFGAFVGLTAASLGALGLVLLRQSRSRGSARTATAPSVGNAAPPLPKICPTCGRMYGGEAQFCGKDGSYLMPAN
jgi:hypothetical protein